MPITCQSLPCCFTLHRSNVRIGSQLWNIHIFINKYMMRRTLPKTNMCSFSILCAINSCLSACNVIFSHALVMCEYSSACLTNIFHISCIQSYQLLIWSLNLISPGLLDMFTGYQNRFSVDVFFFYIQGFFFACWLFGFSEKSCLKFGGGKFELNCHNCRWHGFKVKI